MGGTWGIYLPIIMNNFSRNFCGLQNPRAVQFLKDLIIQKKPIFIFLCETLSCKNTLVSIRRLLKFDVVFLVETQGRSGGIALLWKAYINAQLLGYSPNHIDMRIHAEVCTHWQLI